MKQCNMHQSSLCRVCLPYIQFVQMKIYTFEIEGAAWKSLCSCIYGLSQPTY